jgi:uncharacterized DUF497 family protein
MQFAWDPKKAASNVRDHRVTFEAASFVFGDSLAITFDDPDHSEGERRLLTFGLSEQGRLLVAEPHRTSRACANHQRSACNPHRAQDLRRRLRPPMRKQYKRKDLGKGVRGKYYAAYSKGTNLVLLSPEIAAVFPTSQAVNEALRGLVQVAKESARLTTRSNGRKGAVASSSRRRRSTSR